MSQKSFNSGGFTDDVLKSEQAAGTFQERSSFPGSSVPGRSDSLDLFKAPTIPETVYSAAPVDLFKLPEAPSALSPPSLVSSASSANEFQPSQTSPTYLECFAVAAQPESTKISNEILREFSVPKSEGWATFDVPQPSTPISSNEKISPTGLPSGSRESVGKVDMFSSLDTSMQWPSVQNSSSDGSSNIYSAWNDSLLDLIAPNATRTQVNKTTVQDKSGSINSTNPVNFYLFQESEQLWNAFEDSLGQPHFEDIKQNGELLVGTDKVSSAVNQQLGLTAFEVGCMNFIVLLHGVHFFPLLF